MKQRYGLLGKELGHSYSPWLQSIFGNKQYELLETRESELKSRFEDLTIRGVNITIPYKKTVMGYCTTLSKVAKEVGAVNTAIRQEDGSWYGTNTDVDGFHYLLNKVAVDVSGKTVLVLGSGGASAAVCYVLRHSGAIPVVVSRTGVVNYETIYNHKEAVLLVNTTPVGMYPNNDAIPVNIDHLEGLKGIIDLVYNPLETRLIVAGKKRNLNCVGGLGMLVAQGRAGAELFLDKSILMNRVDEITEIMEQNIRNIILIGMPGSGKTRIGQELSKKIGLAFIDVDLEIEKETGRTPENIISLDGENVFREIEHTVLKKLTKNIGTVIATGGGVVELEKNYPLLVQNGTLYYVKRSLSELDLTHRPLSEEVGIEKLYEQRIQKYESWTSHVILNI